MNVHSYNGERNSSESKTNHPPTFNPVAPLTRNYQKNYVTFLSPLLHQKLQDALR
jgi:hypothetical protein